MNTCHFSTNRAYRYTLQHRWNDGPTIAWVGLNPSTADENVLDPTLRRVKDFSHRWGYGSFIMLNLFAFRATDPEVMKAHPEPVGPDNDYHILKNLVGISQIVACWGQHGKHQYRDARFLGHAAERGIFNFYCLKMNKNGTPIHPLYVRADTPLKPLLHDF